MIIRDVIAAAQDVINTFVERLGRTWALGGRNHVGMKTGQRHAANQEREAETSGAVETG
jgi:hypothetical protein